MMGRCRVRSSERACPHRRRPSALPRLKLTIRRSQLSSTRRSIAALRSALHFDGIARPEPGQHTLPHARLILHEQDAPGRCLREACDLAALQLFEVGAGGHAQHLSLLSASRRARLPTRVIRAMSATGLLRTSSATASSPLRARSAPRRTRSVEASHQQLDVGEDVGNERERGQSFTQTAAAHASPR